MTKNQNMNISKRKNGQLLIVVPFLIVFIVGAILLTINIGAMCRMHVKTQITADIAARDGALTQALALDSITVLNDTLIVLYGVLAAEVLDFLACLPDPFCWPALPELWEAIHRTYKQIKSLQSKMDKIKKAVPALVEAAVIAAAARNGATFGTIWPGTDWKKYGKAWKQINLHLKWSFGIPGVPGKIINWILKTLAGLKGILIRNGSYVTERVNVKVWQNGAPAYGRALLGKDLTFPKITAYAGAKPYWMGCPLSKHNPLDDTLSGWEQRISMITPAFWWDAKMIDWRVSQ